ncbi:hypothetical protein [Microbacterium sp. 2FI]|uniref:hypothetical protein n=1 Tax=Microbacterium sp. 2FI TaxID=2502193 RepID=UPI0010F7384B|nr:hypothetical protein [Microbacterium sp. 2FI]
MGEFFTFLGNYWWLAFPLFGVLASVGGAWERSARRRHKRRLEVLHAKAELKAAQAAARGRTGPLPVSPPTAATPIAAAQTGPVPQASASAPTGTQLERLFAAHDAVTARWLEYELDVGRIIAFPAMSDGRQPLTASFLRAKRIADGLRPASAKARLSREQLTEYRNAVADFEVAFDVAERDARRIRDSSFTDVERKRLDTAKKLLTVAIDQAATPAERQVAYRRVREELDGLILLPDEAIEVLEKKVSLELTTGVQQVPPAAAAPPTTPTQTGPPAPAPAPWPVPARGTGDAPPPRTAPPVSPS